MNPTRALAALGVLAGAAGLSACESTADKSARIASQGKAAVQDAGTLKIKHNADLAVVRAVVVRGAGGAVAAAVEVRNRGASAQRDVPVLIDVRDAAGASLYKNNAVGLQPALQRLASVRAHRNAWWVNDQVTVSGTPRRVSARVGAAAAARAVPDVSLKDVHFDGDTTGRYLTGTVVNPSKIVLRNVPVFAVALKGARVVAAGRALVPKLPAAGGRKQIHFRLFFVGDPRGARVALTVAPTAATSS
ncbi:MAG TPA: hypothetical protein VI318_09875 [Baekduia sp.]